MHLYLMENQGYYKIGIADWPQNRVAQLQVGNPTQIEIVRSWELRNAYEIEIKLHERFHNVRMCGEWFDLGQDGLNELLAFLDDSEPLTTHKLIVDRKLSRKEENVLTMGVQIRERAQGLIASIQYGKGQPQVFVKRIASVVAMLTREVAGI